MCQTMNGMWGYKVEDQKYKSVTELVRLIVKAAAKGSNLLLNIGPQPDGHLPAASLERLQGIGEWMAKYGESIYATSATAIPEQSWGVTTQNGNVLYLHLIEPLAGCPVIQVPVEGKVKSVVALEDGTALKYKVSDGKLNITLPKTPDSADYIIKVVL